MEVIKANPIAKSNNINNLLIFVIALLIFIMAARVPIDSDMWWHLKAGESTWTSGKPTLIDSFSFTRFGTPWVNHSWLAEVFMYLIFRYFGYFGLGGSVALLASISLVLVYLQMDGPALWRGFLLVLAGLVCAPVWSARPQLVSLVLTALVGYVIYLYKWKNKNILWSLPLIFVVWSNLHGGFVLGFIVIGIYIVGEIVNYFLVEHDLEAKIPTKQITALIGWMFLCGIAILVNPNGINTWIIPFKTISVSSLQQLIVEWSSPDFHDITQQPFLWLLLLTFSTFGFSRNKPEGVDVVGMVGFSAMALIARRNIGPFALVSTPILSRYGWPICIDVWKKIENWGGLKPLILKIQQSNLINNQKSLGFSRIINLTIVVILAFSALFKLFVVTQPTLVNEEIGQLFPARAVSQLSKLNLHANILNEYNWGGYLVWFFPQTPVYLDGRTDLFGDEIIGEWMKLIQAENGWQTLLEKRDIRLVLLQPDRPLIKELQRTGWKEIYLDEQAAVYYKE